MRELKLFKVVKIHKRASESALHPADLILEKLVYIYIFFLSQVVWILQAWQSLKWILFECVSDTERTQHCPIYSMTSPSTPIYCIVQTFSAFRESNGLFLSCTSYLNLV